MAVPATNKLAAINVPSITLIDALELAPKLEVRVKTPLVNVAVIPGILMLNTDAQAAPVFLFKVTNPVFALMKS